MQSCSGNHPEFVHLDFADDVYFVGPTMGEKAAGITKIDSSIRNSDVYFLVNESDPKRYAQPVIEKFIDTNRFIREEIAKRYNYLTVWFYRRGNNTEGNNTDELLRTRTTKLLPYFNDDIISRYVWRNGRPNDTAFYDHGVERGAEKLNPDITPGK